MESARRGVVRVESAGFKAFWFRAISLLAIDVERSEGGRVLQYLFEFV